MLKALFRKLATGTAAYSCAGMQIVFDGRLCGPTHNPFLCCCCVRCKVSVHLFGGGSTCAVHVVGVRWVAASASPVLSGGWSVLALFLSLST
jgi:hypothetical protein